MSKVLMEHSPEPDVAALANQVTSRFGLLPNFFRLGPNNLDIKEGLWGFARSAYMDNPLPSRFKERLFVYLSRFCDVRYCIARHIGFLIGLGRTAGDPDAKVHSIAEVIVLLRRPLERGEELERLIVRSGEWEPLAEMPMDDSEEEAAIFAFATHVFLQTEDAAACLKELGRLLGYRTEELIVLLTFIRTAHFWTKVHPNLEMEEDIRNLLKTHEALTECVLRDPELPRLEVGERLLDELASLRERAEASDKLRDMSNRVIQIQDEERRNLARELHDSTAQLLSVLNVNLSRIAERLSAKDVDSAEDVETCRSLASEITDQIRTVSYVLHPPLLDEIGLGAALQWFAEGFEKRSGIAVTVEATADLPPVPREAEIALFRIVQEALANVHRHSGSKTASIRVINGGDNLILEIEDSGRGITKEDLAKLKGYRSGVGIAGMRERLWPFKGTLSVESSAKGAKVTVSLPVHTMVGSSKQTDVV